jgi:hypothetical protein
MVPAIREAFLLGFNPLITEKIILERQSKCQEKNALAFAFSLKYYVGMTQAQKAARILGRLGGLKGGRVRAQKLSPERRKEIAKKAVAARWAKRDEAAHGRSI